VAQKEQRPNTPQGKFRLIHKLEAARARNTGAICMLTCAVKHKRTVEQLAKCKTGRRVFTSVTDARWPEGQQQLSVQLKMEKK
jgi:hypothetical protein